jgi:uncharacterized membrane protein
MAAHALRPHEHAWLDELRHWRRKKSKVPPSEKLTAGQRLADGVASIVGSWWFIGIQTILLAAWLVLNGMGVLKWDPFPFILLNLLLSFQAAYTAPIIMMSQNRQSQIDRGRALEDYHVNCKAELEIELLHQKFDLLREQEITKLTAIIEKLMERLGETQLEPKGKPEENESA